MMRLAAALHALLLLYVVQAHTPHQAALDKAFRLPDGTDVRYATVDGVPRWRLLPYLWYDKTVHVSCPGRKVRPADPPSLWWWNSYALFYAWSTSTEVLVYHMTLR